MLEVRQFKPRKVKREDIGRFWESWGAQRRKGKRLISESSLWSRSVFAFSPSILVTVRRFENVERASRYVLNSRKNEQQIINAKPKSFDIQPIEFIDRREANLLERVYPGPDCYQFGFREGRYSGALKRRLKRKGIDLDKKSGF